MKSGDVVIADDGYAYQTTYRSHAGVYETYVTVIEKDTQTSETTNPVDGEPRQLIVASDAVYQLVHQDGVDTDGDGINDVADKTTVNAISHEASITQYEIAGDTIASDIVADGNGGCTDDERDIAGWVAALVHHDLDRVASFKVLKCQAITIIARSSWMTTATRIWQVTRIRMTPERTANTRMSP